MSFKFSFIIVLLIIVNSVFTQSLVKGTVSDQSGIPLIGVNVFLHQTNNGTISQEDGSYQLEIPSNLRVVTIEYSYIGYRTQSKTITISDNSSNNTFTQNIRLVESPIELQEITVTAGFIKERDAVSYPIETLMKKEIVRMGTVNFSQALSNTPGVSLSSFGNGAGKPIIRGLGNTNLVLLNNGIKQEAFQFSSNHPFLIDELASSHLEIIKGPASLQYGSDAVGGVINVVRERPASGNSLEGDFTSQYYSNTGGYLSSLGMKGSQDAFYFGVRGSLKSHKDFIDGNGDLVYNSRFNEHNFTLNSGLRTGYGLFSVNYSYTDATYGIQNENQINLFASPIISTLLISERKNEVWYQNLKNHLLSSNNTVYLGKNSLVIDLGYQANTRELVGGGINAQNELLTPVVASMQLNTFTYNLKMNIPEGENNFVFGLNGAYINNEADESKPNVPMLDAHINDLGLYAIGDFMLSEKLTFTSGLRYDYRNMESFPVATENTDRFKIDNTYNNINGSLGLTYNFTASQFIKANLARGYRSPNLPELTQNGIHAARFEKGNPDLEAQRNYQLDFNYHLHTPWVTLNISPFLNQVNNYIYVVMTNEDAPIGEGKIFQHVQNDAKLYGGEVALDMHPMDWLGIHGSYSQIRADITDDSEGVEHPTFTPQDRLTGEIKLQRERLGVLDRPYFSVEILNFFEQNRTGQNEAITPAYTLLNARIGTSISFGNQEIDVYVTGRNLTNTTYIDHLSVTKQLGLNMMGRNLMIGMQLPFGFQ